MRPEIIDATAEQAEVIEEAVYGARSMAEEVIRDDLFQGIYARWYL